MEHLEGFMTKLCWKKDGDVVDRFLYRLTVAVLCLFAFFIFGYSFFGTPIQCWFPVQFTGYWQQYALDYCFVQSTYFVPYSNNTATAEGPTSSIADDLWWLPQGAQPDEYWITNVADQSGLDSLSISTVTQPKHRKKVISYYQWVPFVLILMAIVFYVPQFMWTQFCQSSTSNANVIFDRLRETGQSNMDQSVQDKCAMEIGYLLQSRAKLFAPRCSFWFGSSVFSAFLLSKLAAVLICFSQFMWLSYFVGISDLWWGPALVADIWLGREWMSTGRFPRVTFCDFQIRELANLQQHTVQCVLLINMFNEQIFAFLWFWFAAMFLMASASFIYWISFALCIHSARAIIGNYVAKLDPSCKTEESENFEFRRKFLTRWFDVDSLFLFRLVELNCLPSFALSVVHSMWIRFKEQSKRPVHVGPAGFHLSINEYPTLPSKARLYPAKRP